jgi:NAD(P)-dependent dehydrogenase (short-subunit alcohol dehydrogenase family)
MVDISRREVLRDSESMHVGIGRTTSIPVAANTGRRSILITGCSSGIGYHCAHALKKRGWRVFATCRKQQDCDRLAAEGLEAIQMDYEDGESIRTAFEEVMRRTGGTLDALFNNGAYSHPGAIEDLSIDHVRRLFEANVFGWFDLTNRALKVMRKQGHGRIVNCSSVLGFVAVRFTGAYVASKFAIEGWSDALRLELKGSGIDVSIIQPGPIDSRMIENARTRFLETVDVRNSPFRNSYGREISRIANRTRSHNFRRGPEAVFDKLVLAIESPRPRARYRITIPTRVGAWLKRVLPTRIMDRVLLGQR